MDKKLFLIDGMGLIYRAYFVFLRNPLITSDGVNTSAVFGFLNALVEIQENQEPTHIAVAIDAGGPTFRHEVFPEYKAQREETPEGIVESVPIIREMLDAFHIPVLMEEGVEADDVIGTLARHAPEEGYESYMVTADKDFAQLVNDHVHLYRPGRKGGPPEILGASDVREQWGIENPGQVADILGLAGDTSDNIPGVPGIGEKTAGKLIRQFGSVENLLAHTDELKGKQREKIEENRDRARLCKQLVTIRCDVPLQVRLEDFRRRDPDAAKLRTLLRKYELKSVARRLFGEEPAPKPVAAETGEAAQTELFAMEETAGEPRDVSTIADTPHDYHAVSTEEDLKALRRTLKASGAFCLDTETTSLHPETAELIGLSFAVEPHEAWFVPVDASSLETVLDLLRPVLEDDGLIKIGHNLKFDLCVLRWQGIRVRGPCYDTMIAHYLIDPDQRHGMDHVAETLLHYRPIPIRELIGEKGREQKTLRDVPADRLREYAAEDADITLQLWRRLEPMLEEAGQRRVFYEIESPLVPVLAEMECEGIALDTAALERFAARLEEQLRELERIIYREAGMEFNLNSPKQLGEVLFDHLKLKAKPKKTRTGQYATHEAVLESLATEHEIAARLLEHRRLMKLKGTYVDALPRYVVSSTGRVHTHFAQTNTATGRLACHTPNLQNIPIRREEGQEIRRAFVPRSEEFTLLACDYSQVELRIMADLSGDTGMREAFERGEDIHAATASRIYGVEPPSVDRELRRRAKTVNFGLIYGISAFGLAQRLVIPREEGAEIIEQYFTQYPGVREYMERTVAAARETGYVETKTGRRRHIRDIHVRNATVRGAAERNAINAPIQGTAADMIKLAMIRVRDLIDREGLRSRMLLQVHDELVFDLHLEEQTELVPRIEKIMREALPLSVPVVVDSGTGANWLEAH
ncbi:DNA polymerase I [Kiritimatiella glycovorans]|uniref:DNA polymerase I n=1 Tax=Kiritimatiella glycovorans TaxID=1307763 RepID=A0A0G3EBN9_9BACT|nr:DNA polymerase I [Kiritimatiella glycovorans]AKJ63871.1 DNA polymerase I [Kiritimatiella glycovorans]